MRVSMYGLSDDDDEDDDEAMLKVLVTVGIFEEDRLERMGANASAKMVEVAPGDVNVDGTKKGEDKQQTNARDVDDNRSLIRERCWLLLGIDWL
mmetsp:Transcript_26081/g.48644  ORF Transcript_26081/g.48644 Transcript_26081/m.48644 type:complete len:94 (+) Transcript_26081:220-501(+)